MRSAEELYQYAVDHKFGTGVNAKWGTKHFAVVSNALLPDETVLMAFIGLNDYQGMSKSDGYYAYAITDKRIIMGQKQMLAGEKSKTLYLNNINDISFKSGLAIGVMTIDSTREKVYVGLDKASAKAIYDEAVAVLQELKNGREKPAERDSSANASGDLADQLLSLKKLVDAGILTQEEFDAKKKQMLGI